MSRHMLEDTLSSFREACRGWAVRTLRAFHKFLFFPIPLTDETSLAYDE